jgi:cytochrome c551/c552
MFKFKRTLLLFVVTSLLLAACGGAAPSGDATQGKALFEQTTIGPNSAPGCVTCHSLEPDVKLVGPSLAHVATDAAEIIKSSSYTGSAKMVEEYLHESIVVPNAFVIEGFPGGVMYQSYGTDLSKQQIDDLAVFLLTLK